MAQRTSPWMTTDESADYARVCPETIRRNIRSKTLDAVRVGRVYRIRIDRLNQFMEENL